MNHLIKFLSLIVVATMLLSGCASPATPEATAVIASTEEVAPPVVTEEVKVQPTQPEPTKEVPPTVEPEQPTEMPTPSVAQKDVFTIAIAVDPKTLDPFETNNTYTTVFSQMCEPLLSWEEDENGNPVIENVLATGYEWLDDLTLQIKLREGVTFHNGEPFNAESAKLSLEILFSHFQYSQWLEGLLDRVDIIDDFTVNVVLKEPTLHVTSVLAKGSYQIPFKDYQERGKEAFDQAPVCTGPWMFKEQIKDDHITMVANPNYWDGTPAYKEIIFRTIPDDNTRVASLLAGELDIAVLMPVAALDVIESNPNTKLVKKPILRQVALFFDTSSAQAEPLKDPNVRMALNYAIDREAICNQILASNCSLLQGQYLSSSHTGFNPDLEVYPFDPEKAKQMLVEAGYPDGFEMDYTYLPNYKQAAEAISGYLREVGLTINEIVVDYPTWAQQFDNKQMTALYTLGFLFGQDGYLALVSYVPGARFRTIEMPTGFDEAMAKASDTMDEAERIKYLQEAGQATNEDPFAVYLYTPVDLYGVAEWVEGFAPRSDQTFRVKVFGVVPK